MASPPTILHLRTVTGRGGGPEKTLLNSPRFIGDSYQLQLAYIRPYNDPLYDLPQRAMRAGVSLIDVPERGPVDPRTITRLAREIRACRPAILHAHDYKTNLLAVVLGRWFAIPAMTTAHGNVTLGGRLNLYYQVDRWSLPRMSHVVVVCDEMLDTLLAWGVPSDNISVIENGIDGEQFARRLTPEQARREQGFDPPRMLIGAAGRLQAEKGFDRLIHAVDRSIDRGAQVDLVIAGEGPERAQLEALIARLGRQNHIRLLGHRSDIGDLFQAFDLFVLSSLREGLPNVLLEAMATETPVIATRIAGVPRVVIDEHNGLLVDADNVEQLSAAITRLAADAALRRRLAAAGRRTIEERYSFASRMQKMRAVYDRVLGPTEATR